ncbi:MAG: gas vesicle protein, partial [Saprospiraceae bacterium]
MLEEKNPEMEETANDAVTPETTPETVVEQAKSVAAQAVESVKETAAEVVETVKETAAPVVESVKEAVKPARTTVAETAKSIKRAVTPTMTEEDVAEPMPDLDEEIVDDTAHDDFDWDGGNRQVLTYSDSEIAAYIEEYDAT